MILVHTLAKFPSGNNVHRRQLNSRHSIKKSDRAQKKNLQSEPSGNKSSNRAVREREASCLQLNKRKGKTGAIQAPFT